MDIHRCRFVPYPPPAITALAFSHTPDLSKTAPPDLRLALGRENGDIEIWNPLGGRWLQETILRGSAGTTVDQLAWTQDFEIEEEGGDTIAKPGRLRLFSAGSTTKITEWDVSRGTTKRHAEGNFGDIWCFAAQPLYRLPKDGKVDGPIPGQMLVGGCGDASIVLFSTDNDDLGYWRLLAPSLATKAKILSITWRDRNTVVAGYEGSVIKVFDVNTRQTIRTMSLGKTAEGSKSIVWTVKCLPNGTILSGDSSGELKIWDSKNFSCIQRLKTHQADIIDIVFNAKGDLVFTVGVDRRTIAYKPITPQHGRETQRWTKLMHRRYHDHDIKCAASYESKGNSFLVSGGVDAAPIVVPMQNWQSEYHRTLPHLPQQQQISASSQSRLLLAWWQRDLLIYHVQRRRPDGTVRVQPGIQEHRDYAQLATLRLNGDDYNNSAQISQDGGLLVASTTTGVRLFQLRLTTSNGKLLLRSRPIELPPALHNYGARHVCFSPNGRWLLAVRFDNTVVLTKLVPAESPRERPTIHDRIVKLNRKSRKQGATALGDYTRNINTTAFSHDSRVLATGDLSGSIDAWILQGHEDLTLASSDKSDSSTNSSDSDSDSNSDDEDESDSPIIHGQRWIRTPQGTSFPRIDSPILAVTFRPSPPSGQTSNSLDSNIGLHPTRHTPHPIAPSSAPSTTSLVAITATHNITEFDILSGKLTDWSRRNPSSLLPHTFTRIRDRLMGCFWDPSHNRQRLWMYGATWLYMLDLTHDLPLPQPKHPHKRNAAHAESTDKALHDPDTSPKNKKRKRSRPAIGEHSQRNNDRGTGAGGEVSHSDRQAVGYARFGVTYKGPGDDAIDLVDLDGKFEPESSSDEDATGRGGNALLQLRRGAQQNDVHMVHDQINSDNDKVVSDNKTTGDRDRVGKGVIKHWGTTHSYRSIFGLAVLSDPDSTSNSKDAVSSLSTTTSPSAAAAVQHPARRKDIDVDGDCDVSMTAAADDAELEASPNALEIIIVERPMHDVDLPPRFDGGQDWDA